MKFNGLRVYDLAESIVASGFPMDTGKLVDNFENEVRFVNEFLEDKTDKANAKGHNHYMRFKKLLQSKAGSGHNCAGKGVIINVNITGDGSFWQQWQRYHFQDIISSQSKQHRLIKMELNDLNVDSSILAYLKAMIHVYNTMETNCVWDEKEYSKKEFFELIIKSCPMGLELTARVTFNYLQARSMYIQRKDHKMSDWRVDFVKMINSIPFSEDFITY